MSDESVRQAIEESRRFPRRCRRSSRSTEQTWSLSRLKPCSKTPCGTFRATSSPMGAQAGSYNRLDDRDERLSGYDIYALRTRHQSLNIDSAQVEGATISDLSTRLVDRALAYQRESGSRMFDGLDSDDKEGVLRRLGVLPPSGDELTLAGLLALGTYPQQFRPRLTIDVCVHPATAQTADGKLRLVDRKQFNGALPDAVEGTVMAVAGHLRRARVVDGVAGSDELEIPVEVLREGIANGVVHRDDLERADPRAVTVGAYLDRVEITSPGGFAGTRTAENIDDGVSEPRNRLLSALLTEAPRSNSAGMVAENAGTSILKMMTLMENRDPQMSDYGTSSLASVVLTFYRFGLADSPTGKRSDRPGRGVHAAPGDSAIASPARWDVLADLSERDALSIRQISEGTGRNVNTLRPILRALVNDGCVIATAPPTSRNRRYLRAGTR